MMSHHVITLKLHYKGNDPLVLILILAFIVESWLTQSQSPFANGALVLGNAWSLGCFLLEKFVY